MRTINVEKINSEVAQLCKEAAYYLPKDVYEALKKGRETEESPVGQVVLDQIIKNSEIARAEDRPICQDTGMTIIFLEVVRIYIWRVAILLRPSMQVLLRAIPRDIFVSLL